MDGGAGGGEGWGGGGGGGRDQGAPSSDQMQAFLSGSRSVSQTIPTMERLLIQIKRL